VVVLADNDTGGKDHAEKKATTIHGIAASVRVAHFPDTPIRAMLLTGLRQDIPLRI
jgi:hypothetical protein